MEEEEVGDEKCTHSYRAHIQTGALDKSRFRGCSSRVRVRAEAPWFTRIGVQPWRHELRRQYVFKKSNVGDTKSQAKLAVFYSFLSGVHAYLICSHN